MGILGEEIKNGDSRASVVRRLGQGAIVDDEQSLEKVRGGIEKHSATLTDGIRKTDVFVQYHAAEGFAVNLQFRDDTLVNFNLSERARQELRKHYQRYVTTKD